MKNLFGIVFILTAFILNGCSDETKDVEQYRDNTSDQMQTMTKDTQIDKADMTCPVSGEPIENLDHSIEYEGVTYYLCCDKCEERFNENPERYIKKETSLPTADDEGYYTINLPTAVCGMCETTISKALKSIDGVEDVIVSAAGQFAKVKFDESKTSLVLLRQAIVKTGYDADDVTRDMNAYNVLPACCKFENEAHS